MAKSLFDTKKPDEVPLIKAVLEAKNPKRTGKISVELTDPFGKRSEGMTLHKSLSDLMDGGADSVERLAFEINPRKINVYSSLYRVKEKLLPDDLLKRMAIQDDLVAAIANARAFHMSSMGRPQPDRHSTGFKIEPIPGLIEKMSDEEKDALQKQIARAELRVLTCGKTSGYNDDDVLLFSQFLWQTTRQAIIHGRIAVEAIKSEHEDPRTGKRGFHSFRAIDVGTIYKAATVKGTKEAGEAVRQNALKRLAQLKNEKLKVERFENDEYSWIQVIEGQPDQAFTSEECLVHNFYPVIDVELGGYPLTPLDTVISAVTTHINITNHNKLYFQSGRATRGMVIVKSDDANEGMIKHIRQTFQASINSVGNSWRMPIFGVGSDDDVSWYPIDNSSRDMEFQYLSDTNARVILSAFQMSPEELPGYTHLSRGTNNQALSESNNEYKLEAHRDVGLRPLIAAFQDFINYRLMPLIDEDLSKKAAFKFVGLDADTAEKEAIRIQQDMAIHMTYNEVLDKVEKKPIAKFLGGDVPFNPQLQQIWDKYVPVGVILEHILGIPGASKDPRYDYINNPLYFNQIQMLQAAQQAQQQAQQPQQPGGGGGGGQQQQQRQPQQGQDPNAQQGGQDPNAEQQDPGQDQQQDPNQGPEDLTRSLDQLAGLLNKSETQLPNSKRRLLAHQRKVIQHSLRALEDESKAVIAEILDVAAKSMPKNLKKKE